jgi:hypothetical protein
VVRFTYTHPEARYTNGVLADVEQLKAQGFQLEKRKSPVGAVITKAFCTYAINILRRKKSLRDHGGLLGRWL